MQMPIMFAQWPKLPGRVDIDRRTFVILTTHGSSIDTRGIAQVA